MEYTKKIKIIRQNSRINLKNENVFDIKNKEDIRELEYNKVLLLIAIITAAFISIWTGINNAKQILKK